MKKNNIYFYILVVVTFLVISYLLAQKVFQNDTFYTIKIGESIFKHGVDMKDHFSFIADLSYTYPHWLYDSFIYLLYSLGGMQFIYLSTIILGFILLLSIFIFSVKLGNNKYISYLLISFFSFFLSGYFTARAQMFSYISFVVILYSIEMLRKTNKKRYLIYLFLSSLIIANTHAAVWLFIFALYLPFVVQDIIYLITKRFNIKIFNHFNIEVEDSHLKITIIAVLLSLLTGFLTPNFLVPFTYYINTVKGVSLSNINEHSPITISGSYSYVYVLCFLTIILLLNKKVKIKLRELFLLTGLFILAFSSIKNISLLILLSIFTFSRLLSTFNYKNIEPYLWNKYFITALLSIFVITFALSFITYSKRDYVNEKIYPVQASNFIIENLDYENIRLFNQYDYGSYLLYRGIPVFIDSRADLYLEEFNKDCTVFKDYFDTKYNYDLYFSKYQITHVILKNNTPLATTIRNYENYKVIYKDENFTIYDLGD